MKILRVLFTLFLFLTAPLAMAYGLTEEQVNIILSPGESYQGRFTLVEGEILEGDEGNLVVESLEVSGNYGEGLVWETLPSIEEVGASDGYAYRFFNTGAYPIRIRLSVVWPSYADSFGGRDIRTEDTLCLWARGSYKTCPPINWEGYDIDLVDLPVDTKMSLGEFDKRRGDVASTGSITVAYVLFEEDGYAKKIIPFENEGDRERFGRIRLSDYSLAPILVTFHGYRGPNNPPKKFSRGDLTRKLHIINGILQEGKINSQD